MEFESAATAFGRAAGANPLKVLDKNEDGRLTFSEVQQEVIDQRKTLGFNDDHLAEAKKLMTRHDKNRSTFIEDAELHQKPISGQLAKSILRQADEDDDKRISLPELARHLAKQR